MTGAVRLGVIGAGRWGRICAATISRLCGTELAGIASTNPKTAADFACPVFGDWRDLLALEGLDGVVIATPPALHAEMAVAALDFGLAVFVEKPLTLSAPDARKVAERARAKGAVAFVDHIHLFSPAFRELRRQLGELGPIRVIEAEAGNHGPYRDGYGVLWDWGAHDAAMMLAAMGGRPERVAARRTERRQVAGGVGETIDLELDFGPVPARARLSTLIDRVRRFTVLCERGRLVYDDRAPAKLTRDGEAVGVAPTLALDVALTEFADAIRKGEPDTAGLDLGVAVVEVLERCQAALAENENRDPP